MPQRPSYSFLLFWSMAGLLAAACAPATAAAADDSTGIEKRLSDDVQYLADDAREGRGLGTKGINAAADFIAEHFAHMGLKTDLWDGGPFQKFQITIGEKLGSPNTLEFVGPAAAEGQAPEHIPLKLKTDYTPLAIGGSAKFDLPLVFVGYGITAPKENYDDYAGIDVKGKAVIVLRHEPQQRNPHSVFDGTNHTPYAFYARKVSNAYEHGAAAVFFCNDEAEIQKQLEDYDSRWQKAVDQLAEQQAKFKAIDKPSDEDSQKYHDEVNKLADEIHRLAAARRDARASVLPFEGAGNDAGGRDLPIVFCRRDTIEKLFRSATGSDLAKVEQEIDHDLKPQSQALGAWHVDGQTTVIRQESEAKNIGAVLEGEGPLADETLVIGAHYDHLGYGGRDSMKRGSHEIHNGADDNASGVAVLLEVARTLAARPKKLPRRVLFLAFTGEELGLLGSARYVREPLYPLDKTIAMLNMDMVGRLQDRKLIVYGTGTAPEFDPLVERLGKQYDFHITKHESGFGPSDHSSFYAQRIPVMHFFTGNHKDYHTPTDDFEKLNVVGMREVGQFVTEIALTLAEAEQRPLYKETKSSSSQGRGGDRPYFGSIPDFSQDQPGYALSGVTKDGPADKAGLRSGDIIIKLGESRIGNLEDFDSALRKHKAGDKVPVVVKRGKDEVTLDVILEQPR